MIHHHNPHIRLFGNQKFFLNIFVLGHGKLANLSKKIDTWSYQELARGVLKVRNSWQLDFWTFVSCVPLNWAQRRPKCLLVQSPIVWGSNTSCCHSGQTLRSFPPCLSLNFKEFPTLLALHLLLLFLSLSASCFSLALAIQVSAFAGLHINLIGSDPIILPWK